MAEIQMSSPLGILGPNAGMTKQAERRGAPIDRTMVLRA
jgi:hypothetical protein